MVGVSPTIWGYGDQPPGNLLEINPYFMQSEAFCDCFHDIIKAYSESEINFCVCQSSGLTPIEKRQP